MNSNILYPILETQHSLNRRMGEIKGFFLQHSIFSLILIGKQKFLLFYFHNAY